MSTKAGLSYRSFLETLREDGDLSEINLEVDPDFEVGAIVRRVSERNGRAPLFTNVKGANKGLWRICGNAASLRRDKNEMYGRIARGIGLGKDASWKEISHKFREAIHAPPVAPKIVDTGPCKENRLFGDEIDLTELPVPYLHADDGGRYLQSYGINILQSPDKSWTNWSINRAMVHDKRHLVGLVIPTQHIGMIRSLWKKGGRDVPWALALGVPPAATLAAAMPLGEGVNECDYVGAITGQPLEVVKCETNDLYVPATSEIVLEGTLSVSESAREGPFGEYVGYVFPGDSHTNPLYRVNAITHRNNAILPVSVPGKVTDESHTTAALAAPEIVDLCQRHGYPILEAFAPLESLALWVALQVDTKKLRALCTTPEKFCKELGQMIFSDKRAFLQNRILLVGDDIDVYDFKDILWVYTTRCRPGLDEYIVEDVPSFPLLPYMARYENPRRGGKMISNCLLPTEWTDGATWVRADFEHSYPEHVKQRVKANWTRMGLE